MNIIRSRFLHLKLIQLQSLKKAIFFVLFGFCFVLGFFQFVVESLTRLFRFLDSSSWLIWTWFIIIIFFLHYWDEYNLSSLLLYILEEIQCVLWVDCLNIRFRSKQCLTVQKQVIRGCLPTFCISMSPLNIKSQLNWNRQNYLKTNWELEIRPSLSTKITGSWIYKRWKL